MRLSVNDDSSSVVNNEQSLILIIGYLKRNYDDNDSKPFPLDLVQIIDEYMKRDFIYHQFREIKHENLCYAAPELVEDDDKLIMTKSTDWWAFGVILYEMMTGLPPFYNQNVEIMCKKMLTAAVPWLKCLSNDGKELLEGILKRDIDERFGSKEIGEHRFYSSVDWNKMYEKDVEVPYKPCKHPDEDDLPIMDGMCVEEPREAIVSDNDTLQTMVSAQDMFVGFT